jgi:hypothetical protein
MTSRTLSLMSSSGVRNVSENTISAPLTKDTLLELLTLLDAILKHADHKDLYEDMAERLSKIAGKQPAWGWRYVQSVASGTVQPSRKFAKAVDALAVTFDGIPVPFAKSSPVTVYAETGTIMEGSLVMSSSRRCAAPSCTVVFVPNVPWRKLCPVCSPQKPEAKV